VANIKKELILKAKLDKAQLSRDIEAFKRELKTNIKIDAGQMQNLEKSFSKIGDAFSNKIKEAIKELKNTRVSTRGGIQDQRVKQDTLRQDIDKALRAREKQQDKEWNLKYNQIEKETKAKERARKKEELELIKFEQRQKRRRESNLKKEIRSRLQEHKRERSLLSQEMGRETQPIFATTHIPTLEKFRQRRAAGAESGPVSRGGFLSSLGGMGGGAARKVAGAGATAMGLILSTAQLQTQLAERRFRMSRDILAGKQLEAVARQTGRESPWGIGGGLAGAAAGVGTGAIFGGPIGAVLGGLVGGATGYMGTTQLMGERNVERIRMLGEAYQQAKPVGAARLRAMAGGGITGQQLSEVQSGGVPSLGYSDLETMQQFLTARQFMGNRATGRQLNRLQEMQRYYNVDVGVGAGVTEALAGAGGGRMNVNQTIDLLKKGVSAGMDLSRFGKFAPALTDFIQKSAGLGLTDIDMITKNLAQGMAGFREFRGGGQVASQDVQRALQREQRIRQMSMSQTGFSGLGNILGTIQSLGSNANMGQILAGTRVSSTDRPEDVAAMLRIPLDQAKKLVQGNRANLQRGVGTFVKPNTPEGAFITSQELDMSIGETRGFLQSMKGGALKPEGAVKKELALTKDIIDTSEEQKKTIADVTLNHKQVTEGLKNFGNATILATRQLEDLGEEFKKTAERLAEYMGAAEDKNRAKDFQKEMSAIPIHRGGGGRNY